MGHCICDEKGPCLYHKERNQWRHITTYKEKHEIDFPKLYRESDNLDEFVQLVLELGGEEDDAVTMYNELTYKYSGQ